LIDILGRLFFVSTSPSFLRTCRAYLAG